MEPNNFENKLRIKLNERQINPSKNSWNRLEAMLPVSEKPKQNFRWMYLAASFLGFILIATVFFSQTEEAIDVQRQNVVLEEKKNNDKEIKQAIVNDFKVSSENTVQVVATNKRIVKKSEILKHSDQTLHTNKDEKSVAKETVAENDKNKSSAISIAKLKVQVDPATLLASVDNEKTLQSIAQYDTTVKVNSSELLTEVDEELELSFRERVLKSVHKKLKDVKVAVSQRNLE